MDDETMETDGDSECLSNEDDDDSEWLFIDEDSSQNIISEGSRCTNQDERSPKKQPESPKNFLLWRHEQDDLQERKVTDNRKREHSQHPGQSEDQVRKKLKKELKESQRPLDQFRQHSSQHVEKSRLSEERENCERSQNEPHCSKDNVWSGFWGNTPQQNQFPQQPSQHLQRNSRGSHSSQFISPQHPSGLGTSTQSMGINREIPGVNLGTEGAHCSYARNMFGTSTQSMGLNRETPAEKLSTEGAHCSYARNMFGTSTESMGMNREIPGENLGTQGAHLRCPRNSHNLGRIHTIQEFIAIPIKRLARDIYPGHTRRRNHTFSEFQTRVLERAFDRELYPGENRIREIAESTGLTEQQVSDWFENARRNLPIQVGIWGKCKKNEKSQRDPPTN